MQNNNIDDQLNYDHHVYIEKKSGCFGNFMKVGCGFVIGVLFAAYFFSGSPVKSSDRKNPFQNDSYLYEEEEMPIQYFQVRSKKGKATIHTGMPKDSVIILLGQPTEFTTNSYTDFITYRFGPYDTNSLRIEFSDGVISSVSQY